MAVMTTKDFHHARRAMLRGVPVAMVAHELRGRYPAATLARRVSARMGLSDRNRLLQRLVADPGASNQIIARLR